MSKSSIHNLRRFCLFTLTTLFISLSALGQKKSANNSISCQIATIQRDTVLVRLKEYPAQVKILEAYQKQLQAAYEFKKLEFDTKLKDYQEQEASLTDEQKQSNVLELQNMDNELKKFSQEANDNLVKKQQELLLPMNDEINKAIIQVASEHGFLQVIDSKTCYYFDPKCDATQLVIDEANK
jgi:outer membrane protein